MTLPAPKRDVRSHRRDRKLPRLREIDLERLPYVPLPRAPLRWEEVHGGRLPEAVEDRLYIADTNNHRIRVADIVSAEVTTLSLM